MKLTLSSGGGVTGLSKVHSVDVTSLPEDTRQALMDYFHKNPQKPRGNVNETWSIDDTSEVAIDTENMSAELLQLYQSMRSKLSYRKLQ